MSAQAHFKHNYYTSNTFENTRETDLEWSYKTYFAHM